MRRMLGDGWWFAHHQRKMILYTFFFYVANVFFCDQGVWGVICWYSCFYSFLHYRQEKAAQTPSYYTRRKKGRKVFRRVYLGGWQFLEHYKK